MLRQTVIFGGFLLFLMSCETVDKVEETISKEHAALIGTWQEEDSTETILWNFDQHEVKWKGFTHYYKVSGDSLLISGLVYRIKEQSEKKVQLVKLDGKSCTLNRKD